MVAMTKEERARKAEELLTNPLYLEVVENLRAAAVREWAAADNPLDRDYCHARYVAASGLHKAILAEVERASNDEVRAGTKDGHYRALYNKVKELFR